MRFTTEVSFSLGINFSLAQEPDDENGRILVPTYGIIGIMNIKKHIFIIIITGRQLVAKLPSDDFVYLIKGVEFLPFDRNIMSYQ